MKPREVLEALFLITLITACLVYFVSLIVVIL